MDASQGGPATDLRALRAAGLAGLAFAVLLTTSLTLLRMNGLATVGADGSTPPVSDTSLIALYLVPFAGITFIWFLAVLRRRIGRAEDQFFSTVFLATGLLFVALLFAAGATASAAAIAARSGGVATDSAAFQFGRALAATLFYGFAIKMAAAFMLVSSTIGRRTGFLPRWLIALGIVGGLVMLFSVGFFEPLALIFPAWVAVVSILILRADPAAWSAA
jgi:hypothetical protein